MRIHLLGRIAVAVCVAATGVRAEELTERQALERFLSEGPYQRRLEATVAVAEAETSGWSLWPNPSAGYIREGAGLTEFYQFEQPLAVSGRLSFRRKAGVAAVDATRSLTDYERWQQVSDVRSAFYTLLAAQDRGTLIDAGVSQLDEVVRILSLREREGEGSTYDRLRAERERSEVIAERISAQVSAAQASSRLGEFLGTTPGRGGLQALGELDSGYDLPSVSALLDRALGVRGDYAAQSHLQIQFQFEADGARRLRIPEPSVLAGLKRADVGGRIENGGFVAVSVPLPLFNRGKTEVARYRAEADRAEAHSQILERRIRAEVTAAHETVTLRRQGLADYRRQVQQANLRLEEIARTAYQEGEVGILELLDAYSVSLQTRLRTLELASAARQAEIELERAVGEPVLNNEVLP